MRTRPIREIALIAVLLCPTVVSAQQKPTDLGDLGKGRAARATLVSERGAIVGAAQTGGQAPNVAFSAFYKPSGGALRNIAFNAPSSDFVPVAINASGTIVGTVSVGGNLTGSKKWTTAGHQDVPVPPEYTQSRVTDIDDAGNILLQATQEDWTTPFLLSASGTFTEIACSEDRECVPLAMNEAGVIVGYSTDGERQLAVVWDRPGELPRALPTPASVWSPVAVDINADGVIIGNAEMQDSFDPTTALLVWTSRNEEPRKFDNSVGRALNNRGQIVGASWAQGGNLASGAASLWDARGDAPTQLPGLAEGAPSEASDINDAGLVVGSAVDGTGTSRAVSYAVAAR